MKIGDLIIYGGLQDNPAFPGCLGVLLRRLHHCEDDLDEAQNWDGAPAWWIQFVEDSEPLWAYEEELTLVTKGN